MFPVTCNLLFPLMCCIVAWLHVTRYLSNLFSSQNCLKFILPKCLNRKNMTDYTRRAQRSATMGYPQYAIRDIRHVSTPEHRTRSAAHALPTEGVMVSEQTYQGDNTYLDSKNEEQYMNEGDDYDNTIPDQQEVVKDSVELQSGFPDEELKLLCQNKARVVLPEFLSPISSAHDDPEKFKKYLVKYGVYEKVALRSVSFSARANRIELPAVLSPISVGDEKEDHFRRHLEKYGVMEEEARGNDERNSMPRDSQEDPEYDSLPTSTTPEEFRSVARNIATKRSRSRKKVPPKDPEE